MLKAGTKAPQFTAQNQDGRTVRLEDFIGKKQNVVLYFFPKDSTPG